jgi:hypothetical protein
LARAVSLFHAVSNKAEATNNLISIGIAASVSLFRDFGGGGSQFELGCAGQNRQADQTHARPFPENSETVKQRPNIAAKANSCLFRLRLKHGETVKQPNQTMPVQPKLEGNAHA